MAPPTCKTIAQILCKQPPQKAIVYILVGQSSLPSMVPAFIPPPDFVPGDLLPEARAVDGVDPAGGSVIMQGIPHGPTLFPLKGVL